MMRLIPAVLDAKTVEAVRRTILAADWIDGRRTAGEQARLVKANRQLPADSAAAAEAGNLILAAIGAHPAFLDAALPSLLYPPLFNRHGPGEHYGWHVDNAIQRHQPSDTRLRADLAATIFLSDPADYDGGALAVRDRFGVHHARPTPGDMILYPASSLHGVEPVTRGERLAAVTWVQSLIADDHRREQALQAGDIRRRLIERLGPADPEVVALGHLQANLIRMWGVP